VAFERTATFERYESGKAAAPPAQRGVKSFRAEGRVAVRVWWGNELAAAEVHNGIDAAHNRAAVLRAAPAAAREVQHPDGVISSHRGASRGAASAVGQ
jgi:hypothetical protein